jgi:hypothetical protein
MASVALNTLAFAERYPAFAGLSAQAMGMYFAEAALYVSNRDDSIVVDLAEREVLLYMMMAHIISLSGGDASGSESGLVGRISSATEGSVSVSAEYPMQSSAMGAWLVQTKYGAQFLALTSKYRRFRFEPVARNVRLYGNG